MSPMKPQILNPSKPGGLSMTNAHFEGIDFTVRNCVEMLDYGVDANKHTSCVRSLRDMWKP